MAKLIYSSIASLDGYVADENGDFDWSAPDEEVHAAANDLERPIGTYLYGRRMYEVMAVWEEMGLAGEPAVVQDFATIWRAAEKIVYSTTLKTAMTSRTRIEREFTVEAIRRMKAQAEQDISIGGPELAAQALAAGLVDEYQLFLTPIVIGGGTPSLPRGLRIPLELLGERRFAGGVVQLHYRVAA